MTGKQSRRDFIRSSAVAGVGASLAMSSAASYARILGANDRLNIAVTGLRSRGNVLARAGVAVGGDSLKLHTICDVDANVLSERGAEYEELTGSRPQAEKDFRRVIDDKSIDAVVIATPDHTHAPFAIYAVQAGKHVYVEKPATHNPREGELLVAAAKNGDTIVQLGNQQRSAPTSIEAIKAIHEGLIGRAYMGKAWYANNRLGIGVGKKAPVPEWLDWDLWQGPAPRRDYHDNYVHYNWHWFWHWGTGEINNNGLHEIDICRWALEVDYPVRVNSAGGRYHFDDDWEFYDTQIANYEYEGGKMISWEGRSCNQFPIFGGGRGATIHGTEGTVHLDRNGYSHYDNQGNLVRQVQEAERSATTDVVGEGALDHHHFTNFLGAIRDGEQQHSPIDAGCISTTLCHLGNIAQEHGGVLDIDPRTGRILGNAAAMEMWGREYEGGWEID